MAPTYHSGEVFVMSRAAADTPIARGDTVIFELRGQVYIKRVVALPGETVWGLDSSDIEGYPDELLKPAELKRMRDVTRRSPAIGRVVHVHVPPSHIFVLGDNETASLDSRNFGPIPLRALRGRVVASVTRGLASMPLLESVAYAKDRSPWRRPPRWRSPAPNAVKAVAQASLERG